MVFFFFKQSILFCFHVCDILFNFRKINFILFWKFLLPSWSLFPPCCLFQFVCFELFQVETLLACLLILGCLLIFKKELINILKVLRSCEGLVDVELHCRIICLCHSLGNASSQPLKSPPGGDGQVLQRTLIQTIT